ncbi:hypothetical protein [Brachyspira pilosicoli]|uniref:Uncharacterized protein n=1 Tax=Brachyspira pilosicoli TaxID=52584 RepID=A0A5C8FAP6_BRAPL|nr:hypothetical protein [Brachyspira pilosicoli]TXJ46504.1 hypothetical protein EPJ72_01680 [Brachyspira pilosicoli]
MKKISKNPFLIEVERKFGKDSFEYSAFMRGSKKFKITKEEIDDRYNLTLKEFAYYAQVSGFKVLSDADSLIIFKE